MPRRSSASPKNWTTFCSMSDEPAFRCPVCRANQSLRETCRRCGADLRLIVRSRRRLDYLLSERDKARAAGDREREEQIIRELRWLSPVRLKSASSETSDS